MRKTEQSKNWQTFYDSARGNEVLGEQTTIVLHLAVAMAVGCYP